MKVSSEEVGRRAAQFLIGTLEGRDVALDFECDAEIIVRKSSGPPPAER
jgi:LacI family transcriptional regulator